MTVGKININETLAKVDVILREDKSASPQFRAMMELLVVVINLLVEKLGLNSSNSSIPPSKDTKRKRGSKRKAKGKKRKPGGQNGHKGTNLKRETPDRIEKIHIDRRTLPSGDYKDFGYESRQVIEINITKQVTEYQAQILQDANGNQFVADFPPGVTRPVQYGSTIKSQSVYMSQHQLLPYERVREYFADQCGIAISAGSLFNFNKQAYELLEKFELIAKRQLISQRLLHADETGINVNGKLLWLHTASNERWTLFFPHAKRGLEAMKSMGVLEHFRGVLCHDHWKPYFKFTCLHALCNAHHLRELERAYEHDNQRWAKKMKKLLLEIREATEKSGGRLTKEAAKRFRSRYRNILTRGDRECLPPDPKYQHVKRGRIAKSKSRNLLERLRDYEAETLRFMTEKIVPFTNNQGENDIRMTKVQQKISGCFRSADGAKYFCRIRSYLSTCSKNGISPTDALQMLFSVNLPEFIVYPK